MIIYYIRHAQSANNALFTTTGARIGRVADPDLTDIGVQQVQHLTRYIADRKEKCKITHVYTSLMNRAIQTAIPLAKTLEVPLLGNLYIHESGGMYMEDELTGELMGQPGKNRNDLLKISTELILPESVDGYGWWNRSYELPDERPARARKTVEWLLEQHQAADDHIILVSHHGFFNHFIWAFLNQPRAQGSWLTLHNTSITRLDVSSTGINVAYINRLDHLPSDLVTI